MSTEDDWAVQIARDFVERNPGDKHLDSDFAQACRKVAGGADRRDADHAAIRQRYKWSEIYDHHAGLENAAGEALTDVETYPVNTIADLLAKLEFMEDQGEDQIVFDVLLEDIRRIKGGRA